MQNNRKKLCVALLAGICVTANGYAALDGAYTTTQLGMAGGAFSGAGPYIHFALGDQLSHYLALEAGVTAIPTTSDGQDSWIWDDVSNLYSVDGDVKVMLPLGDRFNLYAKAGPSLAYIKYTDGNHDGVALMGNGALGVAFNITEHWTTDLSVGLMIGDNTGVATTQLGLGYHFA